jgi:hypothetical protein
LKVIRELTEKRMIDFEVLIKKVTTVIEFEPGERVRAPELFPSVILHSSRDQNREEEHRRRGVKEKGERAYIKFTNRVTSCGRLLSMVA